MNDYVLSKSYNSQDAENRDRIFELHHKNWINVKYGISEDLIIWYSFLIFLNTQNSWDNSLTRLYNVFKMLKLHLFLLIQFEPKLLYFLTAKL